jgi:glutamine amidotransferase
MSTLAVIDYGMGNLHSVAKAVEHVADAATRVTVTADADAIMSADRVIFPGVGAIRDCMSELQRLELDGVLRECAQSKPLLGVCLGMHALMEHSEENNGVDCLGVFPGTVRRFANDLKDDKGERLKIPHMGWNEVFQAMAHPLWKNISDGSRFYFVHSYYVEPQGPDIIAGSTNYGGPFTSVIARDNVFAAQFHPEKSQHSGLTLLENFVQWDGSL